MEIGDDGGEGKRTPAAGEVGGSSGERPAKRMMKSPFQLEMLEKTYATDPYPSESVRADLSTKIGLTDRQLQMWFCHRRLKDRKPSSSSSSKRARKEEQEPSHSPPLMPPPPLFPPPAVDSLLGPGSMPVPVRTAGRGSTALPRLGPPRYYEPAIMAPPVPVSVQLSAREMRAVANVERMLGGSLREDGPILGIEFEPLPPGAFGAPLVPEQQKQPVRSYDTKLFTRHEPKALKASAFLPSMDNSFTNPTTHSHSHKRKAPSSSSSHKAPKEYQFLPEQPSYEQAPAVSHQPPAVSHHHFYDSPNPGYTFQGQIVSTPPVRAQVFAADYEAGQTGSGSGSYGNTAVVSESQFGASLSGSDSKKVVNHEEEAARLERKRKSEEARIAKEVEAHEKRIRRELEKQDMLRRKREEQVRKEMERQDRERRKEEERLLRERQREEERFQREQKKEIERREKFLIKESLRAEKQRQKEEQRKEREAARQKAATERATARKIAREYMELIEDERLELMEIAAHKKGLPSMLNLDSETLNQLHSFRDLLSKFPPDSVKLKRPFGLEPWTGSEDNVGNLLMVWQFLITFADVLGLWPFTLDEFVQALHDYESRLLGEIHVALLRGIIKDIEDVARAPAVALGANQPNPSGGHPQIVEGAYAWGFSIRNWQTHLGFLTWPEILRQFALAAGLGPKLRPQTPNRIHYHDDHEGEDGENVIMTLRNGSAAENAVALMKERGYTHKRKSRHRLTPGTVKFAAFHVLSLEGSQGLTILEVADRIQKSGLRDLTTSKTPEASIAAALSRDVKLFERTAPSTYCVRTPYRKDPADTDEILSAALEKIRAFQNTLSDSDAPGKDVVDHEDADVDADGDDVIIRDEEDSECEDDADVDPPDPNDANLVPKSDNIIIINNNTPVVTGATSTPVTNSVKPTKDSESTQKPNKITAISSASETAPPNGTEISQQEEETEIDESNYGEAWVQGLSEGDYSELSVEEKLKALVALTGVAIAGNSIRAILEERLEAANTLKKQMWADAQLDKRRIKEDHSSKTPPQFPSSHPNHDISDNTNNNTPTKNEESLANGNNNLEAMHQQYGFAEKSRAELKAFIGHKAEQQHVYRSLPLGQDRRRNRYWVFAANASPNDPGTGRIVFESRDGSWRLIDSEEAFESLMSSLDTRGIRESHLHSMLARIEPTFKEAIKRRNSNSFIGESSLSPNSTNNNLSDSSSTSTLICSSEKNNLYSDSFLIQLGRTENEKIEISKRYQEFIQWMWAECFENRALNANKYGKKRDDSSELVMACEVCYKTYLAEEGHCFTCHEEFRGYVNFAEHLRECEERKRDPNWRVNMRDTVHVAMGIKLLKAKLATVEVSLPEEALKPFWTEEYRKSWGARLQNSSSAEEVFQLLTLLEAAINQDYLSSSFETTSELLHSSITDHTNPFASITVLPWVPETAPAVALRLLDLDSSVCYTVLEKNESFRDKRSDDFLNFPSRYATLTNPHELNPNHPPQDPLDFQFTTPSRRGRGRGSRGGASRAPRGRGRGGRPPKHLTASSASENPYLKPKRSYNRRGGRPRGGSGGRKRGRRSVRGQGGRGGAIRKESLLGSFNIISNVGGSNNTLDADGRITRDVDVAEASRSSGEEEEEEENWGVEAREDLLNGEMSADEYVERTSSQYSGEYVNEENEEVEEEEEEEEEDDNDVMDGNNIIGHGDEEEEDEDDDGNQYGVQYAPQHVNREEEEDDVEMMDEDEEDEDEGAVGNNNGDDDNDDGGYSDYSD
ncbi:hypothetical protein LUZ60_008121 [Juncus effusus]|nr:hypothetical protein LUZ60_008121 [Juncus effusus]